MRKLVVIALVIGVLVSGVSLALENTPENRGKQVDRYFAATPPKEMFKDAAKHMAKNMPVAQRKNFIDLMTNQLDITVLVKSMKAAMIKHFTADELKALADFYSSPMGKSAMKKFGVYMAEVMPAIQSEVRKAAINANRKMTSNAPKK